MCRTTDCSLVRSNLRRQTTLNVKAFYIHVSGLKHTHKPLLESLTLVYLPRIGETDHLVNVRPNSSSFVTLHRYINISGMVFGSREPVQVEEGVSFEVYLRDTRILEGKFKKHVGNKWKVECKSCGDDDVAAEVEVKVVVDASKKKRCSTRFDRLETILEEGEDVGSDCGCCDCRESGGSDGGNDLQGGEEELSGPLMEMNMELEGVRWAVDVAIWVGCLGVGYLVSKASAKA